MVLDEDDYTLTLIGLDIQAISFRTVSAERRLEKKTVIDKWRPRDDRNGIATYPRLKISLGLRHGRIAGVLV